MFLSLIWLIITAHIISSCDQQDTSQSSSPNTHLIYKAYVTDGSTPAEIRYLLIKPPQIKKSDLIVLFPGGKGTCHFGTQIEKTPCGKTDSNSIELSGGVWVSYNFLARNADFFAKNGHMVILLDMPDDVKNTLATSYDPKFVSSAYRSGGDWDSNGIDNDQDILKDIEAVINHAVSQTGFSPSGIYFIGTSRGTLASAYAGANFTSFMVKGIISTATISSDNSYSYSYCRTGKQSDFSSCTDLQSFSQKILFVHHKNDNCAVSSYISANSLFSSLTTPNKKFISVSGGSEISSNPCRGKTYHGFYGRDSDVVNLILDWIEGKSVPDNI